MNRIHPALITGALILCVLLTAGCTGTTGTSAATPVPTQAAGQLTPVSIHATPVQYKDVNGVRLAYWEFGSSGEPVLLIEGFDETVANDTLLKVAWNETFLTILSSKYHVYAYDHRGIGYSSDNNVTHTIPLYADDAAGLIRALGYDSMHVYGESMGSSVSQQLVIDHPDQVRKLILDSNTYDIRIPACRNLFTVIQETAANSSAPAGLRNEATANLAWNGTWDSLSGINKSVLLMVGTADIATPQSVSVGMAGQINGSWLVRFQGLPHVGSHEAPVQYAETAVYFLGTDEAPLSAQ